MKITLEAARVNAHYTINQAAKILGIAVSTLSSYENGKTYPKANTLSKMAELYGCPIENMRIEVERDS